MDISHFGFVCYISNRFKYSICILKCVFHWCFQHLTHSLFEDCFADLIKMHEKKNNAKSNETKAKIVLFIYEEIGLCVVAFCCFFFFFLRSIVSYCAVILFHSIWLHCLCGAFPSNNHLDTVIWFRMFRIQAENAFGYKMKYKINIQMKGSFSFRRMWPRKGVAYCVTVLWCMFFFTFNDLFYF